MNVCVLTGVITCVCKYMCMYVHKKAKLYADFLPDHSLSCKWRQVLWRTCLISHLAMWILSISCASGISGDHHTYLVFMWVQQKNSCDHTCMLSPLPTGLSIWPKKCFLSSYWSKKKLFCMTKIYLFNSHKRIIFTAIINK